MKNLINEILNNKHKEVAQKKKNRDFLGAFQNPKAGNIAIIAEIKLVTPTEGKLGEEKDIEKRVIMYGKGGADAIAMVVDQKYFGGNLEFIKRVKRQISLPILAKDFIVDPYQIYEMKAYGADAILLIARIITQDKLKQFVSLCFDVGLEPVVEVQNERELDKTVHTDTRLIAVNARDLRTFEVDIDKACKLLKLIPEKFAALGFSGVLGRSEVEKYKKVGAKGVLVGTSLMKTKNIEKLIQELKGINRVRP